MNKIIKDNVPYGDAGNDKMNPFDRVHSWITHDFNISSDALRLYIILENAQIDSTIESKNYHPTSNVLASQFGVNLRTLKRYFKELTDFGYVSVGRKSYIKNGDMKFTNDYVISIHPIPNKEKYRKALLKKKQVTKLTPVSGDNNDTTLLL